MQEYSLKIPCTFEERRPLLLDGLFYVPAYYFAHEKSLFPGFEDSRVFAKKQPLCVEICSGNGEWIVNKAKMNPEYNYLAIEMDFGRVRKIWKKKKKENLSNLFIIFGEALTFLQNYISSCSVDVFYVNFPDPWPKKKHAKHRLLKEPFFEEISRLLVKEGSFILATDDEMTSELFIHMARNQKGWISEYPKPFYKKDLEEYGDSFFSRLWREKGKHLLYHHFRINLDL